MTDETTSASRARRSVTFSVAAAVVAVALLAVGGPALAGATSGRTLHLTADFPRTIGLYPKSVVQVQGVRAGTVDAVKPLGEHVEVRFHVSDVALAPNAIAIIRLQSMIGARYLEVGPVWSGQGAKLADGTHLPETRTQVPAETSELLDESGRVADKIDAKAMGQLVAEMGKALGGRRDAVSAMTAGMGDVGRVLSARAGELDGTLTHLQQMMATLSQHDTDMVRLLRSGSAVSDALLAQQGALSGAVSGLDDLLSRLADFTSREHDKVLQATAELAPIGKLLAEHEAGWQKIINLGPYYAYGWFNAIHYDGRRWWAIEQPQGLVYTDSVPYMHPLNDRGGPGSNNDDHTVMPSVDASCSVVAQSIPWMVDLTGITGPGPLLPELNIGNGTVTTSDKPNQAYSYEGYQGAPRQPDPQAPSGSKCDRQKELKPKAPVQP